MEWEQLNAGPWDAAIKGSSALRAGILSVLCDELAVRTGNDTLSTLFDMEKFYDNLDILKLIELADQHKISCTSIQPGLANAHGS